jgi:hypothetical protein
MVTSVTGTSHAVGKFSLFSCKPLAGLKMKGDWVAASATLRYLCRRIGRQVVEIPIPFASSTCRERPRACAGRHQAQPY